MNASQTSPAVHKAAAVLEFISESSGAVTVKEIIYNLEIPPATCYRIVRTLVEHDFLREEPAGGLRMGFGVARLARSYSAVETAVQKLRVPLKQLATSLQLSAKLSLREGDSALTLLRAEPPSPNAITSPVGQRIPLIRGGSVATALLSILPDGEVKKILGASAEKTCSARKKAEGMERIRAFRKSGVAFNPGLQHPSIYAMSMLVRLTEEEHAAVSVVGWPEDFEKSKLPAITATLRESVAAMNRL